ncbi:MAG: 23S rRNA (pseudouridine(1915)-N(3))-methyltransferase RlmH [Pseudomonadota bacterium]
MRLSIHAVGRLKDCLEAALVKGYLSRAATTGRPIGFGSVDLREVDERKARDPEAQASALLIGLAGGARAVVLEERGTTVTSTDFAKRLADWRDTGSAEAAFLIGGADGHGAAVRRRADLTLSLGPMVWPHRLVRVMLAEQLYRAMAILAGTPYHRE